MPAGPVIARVAGAVALIGSTLGAQSPAVKPLVDKDHRRMQPEAATFTGTTINIVGDPSQPGIYVVRRLFKSGEINAPHYHDQDRYVTVIKGLWWTGEGDAKRPSRWCRLRPAASCCTPPACTTTTAPEKARSSSRSSAWGR